MTSSGLRRDLVARYRLRDWPDDIRDRGLRRIADDDGERRATLRVRLAGCIREILVLGEDLDERHVAALRSDVRGRHLPALGEHCQHSVKAPHLYVSAEGEDAREAPEELGLEHISSFISEEIPTVKSSLKTTSNLNIPRC